MTYFKGPQMHEIMFLGKLNMLLPQICMSNGALSVCNYWQKLEQLGKYFDELINFISIVCFSPVMGQKSNQVYHFRLVLSLNSLFFFFFFMSDAIEIAKQ